MNNYTYNNKQIELIKYIINNPPIKIWYNFLSYVFEYDSQYIGIYCTSRRAASINESDEAIIATVDLTHGNFVPTGYEQICEHKPIIEAHIVRSFLYFTTYTRYSSSEMFFRRLKYWIKRIFILKTEPVEELTVKTVGEHQEISCSPDSPEAKLANNENANLIDKGLLLKIGDVYLPAYINWNSYGFPIFDNKYFYTKDELSEDLKIVKLIKII
ncbi:hypothetical protein [Mucilaginibacter sp.]|jgi:hypothetical protein|uniref:hypothetical protein n=1 Tax=Mucilaginibacter sp. TaxID=1882438 RepID=UPI0035615966